MRILLILGMVTSLFSEPKCIELIEGHIAKMEEINAPVTGVSYYLDMDVYYKDNPMVSGGNDVSAHNKLFLSSEQLVLESSQVDVYQTKTEIAVVAHSQKRIYRSNQVEFDQKKYTEQMNLIQHKIIENPKSCTCDKRELNQQEYTIVRLDINEELKEALKVRELIFTFDAQSNLNEVEIRYPNSSNFITQRMKYNALDLNYKGWSSRPIEDYLFDDKGDLVERLAGYQIIDNRD